MKEHCTSTTIEEKLSGMVERGPRACAMQSFVSMRLIYDPKDLCIVNFKPIDGKVICESNEVMADLSTDQLYL